MSSRPILIALVAALAVVLACLRFLAAPPSAEPGIDAAQAAQRDEAAPEERASLVGAAPRVEERVDVVPEADVADTPLEAAAADEALVAPPAEALLRGLCVDSETKAPVADALVLLADREARTADDGTFALAWPSRGAARSLVVQHAGFVEQRVVVEREHAGEPIEVHLRRGLPLALEVVDALTGSPLAGAAIVGGARDRPFAVSDERGRLAIRVLPGASFECSVSADGYSGVEWSWRVTEAQAEGRDVLPLVPAAWIEGTVVDGGARGIAGAELAAFQQELTQREYRDGIEARWSGVLVPGNLSFATEGNGRLRGATDAAGAYRVAVPPSSSPYVLAASRSGYVTQRSEGLVLDAPLQRRRADFVLAHGATLEGRVVRNDEPWSGELLWSRPGERERRTAVRDGRYRIADVEPGALRLAIVSDFTGELACEELLEVAAGETVRKDLAWRDEVDTIAGRVVRAGGDPVGDVLIGAAPAGSRERERLSARSGADGAFAIEVPPQRVFDVTVYAGAQRAAAHDVASGASEVLLVLADTGTLELSLVDRATQSPVTSGQRRFLSWAASGTSRLRPVSARLASDGSTTLTLPIGRVDLAVDLTELGYARKTLTGVLVSERGGSLRVELERGVDVRFSIGESRPRELRRHAVFLLEETQRDLVRGPFAAGTDQNNTRINGLNLWVGAGIGTGQLVEFDRRGKARLQGLVPGRYVLKCFPDDVRLEPDTILLLGPGLVDVALSLVVR